MKNIIKLLSIFLLLIGLQINPKANDSNDFNLNDLHDLSSLNNSSDILPLGLIVPEYSHSNYEYVSHQIISHDVGPRINDRFLFSLPGGSSLTLTERVSDTASVSFDFGVEAGIKDVIKLKLGLNASYSKTVESERNKTYTAPSQFESCSYYSAINYDLYRYTIYKYDIYNKVDQRTGRIYDKSEYRSVKTIDVKVPKIEIYYKGNSS